MEKQTLQSKFSKQKTFYDKSFVIKKRDPPSATLYSYKQEVLTVDQYYKITKINPDIHFSNTTMRHTNEFLQQYGLKKCTRKLWKNACAKPSEEALLYLNEQLAK